MRIEEAFPYLLCSRLQRGHVASIVEVNSLLLALRQREIVVCWLIVLLTDRAEVLAPQIAACIEIPFEFSIADFFVYLGLFDLHINSANSFGRLLGRSTRLRLK